ncbi:quinolinate synthetase complex, A subunit [Corynebacterium sp. KPL1818]|nr:quinolinate synthetase complex, A subunit [Corynebacterium sp. KPL1818]
MTQTNVGVMPSAAHAGSDPEAPKAWAERIKELAEQRNAVILAHNYQIPEIQDVAHHTGDSLALSRKAAETDADIIVFCGVHFMAESAKILSPNKKVLIPDERAGCSLADSITADELRAWKSEHPDALVVSYVNTTAEVKALTDVCCTSSNAVDVVNSLPADKEILFCPDQFLGAYVKRETGRENIRIWAGECHVHAGISAQQLTQQTQDNPDADLYIHPECGCSNSALYLANEGLVPQERVHMLSTGQMITQSQKQPQNKVLVATETGMLHQLRQAAPDIDFQAVNDHAECKYMKMITPEALERCLVEETDEVTVPEDIANAARKSLEAMISIGNPGGGE